MLKSERVSSSGVLAMEHVVSMFQRLVEDGAGAILGDEDYAKLIAEPEGFISRMFGGVVLYTNKEGALNNGLRGRIEQFVAGEMPIPPGYTGDVATLDRRIGDNITLLLINSDNVENLGEADERITYSPAITHWTTLNLKRVDGNIEIRYADSLGLNNGQDKIPICVQDILTSFGIDQDRVMQFESRRQNGLSCGYYAAWHALKMLGIGVLENPRDFLVTQRFLLEDSFGAEESKVSKKAKTKVLTESYGVKKGRLQDISRGNKDSAKFDADDSSDEESVEERFRGAALSSKEVSKVYDLRKESKDFCGDETIRIELQRMQEKIKELVLELDKDKKAIELLTKEAVKNAVKIKELRTRISDTKLYQEHLQKQLEFWGIDKDSDLSLVDFEENLQKVFALQAFGIGVLYSSKVNLRYYGIKSREGLKSLLHDDEIGDQVTSFLEKNLVSAIKPVIESIVHVFFLKNIKSKKYYLTTDDLNKFFKEVFEQEEFKKLLTDLIIKLSADANFLKYKRCLMDRNFDVHDSYEVYSKSSFGKVLEEFSQKLRDMIMQQAKKDGYFLRENKVALDLMEGDKVFSSFAKLAIERLANDMLFKMAKHKDVDIEFARNGDVLMSKGKEKRKELVLVIKKSFSVTKKDSSKVQPLTEPEIFKTYQVFSDAVAKTNAGHTRFLGSHILDKMLQNGVLKRYYEELSSNIDEEDGFDDIELWQLTKKHSLAKLLLIPKQEVLVDEILREIFFALDQILPQMVLQRKSLRASHSFSEIDSPIGLFAAIRLALRSIRRVERNFVDEFGYPDEDVIFPTKVVRNVGYEYESGEMLETQFLSYSKSSRDYSRTDKVDNFTSYFALAENINKFKKRLEAEKIILTDKYIVGAVRDNLAGKKVFLPNSDDGKQPSLALIRQFRQNIVSVITHAFFVVEAERNPSSVAVHQMALDLAAAHNNLEEFLGGVADNPHTKKAPMMRVGAVAVARKKNDILSRYMPWHVEYIGDDESSSKTSELEFGIIELVTKEALIFDEWLRLRLISPEFMNEALLMACDEWYGIDNIFSFKSGDKNKIADFLEKFLKKYENYPEGFDVKKSGGDILLLEYMVKKYHHELSEEEKDLREKISCFIFKKIKSDHEYNQSDLVLNSLAAVCYFDYVDDLEDSLLLFSAGKGYRNLFNRILDCCSIDVIKKCGSEDDNSLMWAIKNGWFEESLQLIEYMSKSSLEICDNDGESVMFMVAGANKISVDQKKDLCKLIIDKRVALDKKFKETDFYKENKGFLEKIISQNTFKMTSLKDHLEDDSDSPETEVILSDASSLQSGSSRSRSSSE